MGKPVSSLPKHVIEYVMSRFEMHRAVQALIDGAPMSPEEQSMLITQLEIFAAVGALVDEIGDKALMRDGNTSAQSTIPLSQLPIHLRFRLTMESGKPPPPQPFQKRADSRPNARR